MQAHKKLQDPTVLPPERAISNGRAFVINVNSEREARFTRKSILD
jgi:hypothetical protein